MKQVSLGNIVQINPSSIGKAFPFDEIDYIDISSVGTGTLSGTNSMKLEDAPSRAKRLVAHGDTILATVRPNLRSFLYIKNPTPNTVASTGFAVLRATDKIDQRYLYYSVTSQSFTDYLSANVKGAAYPAVDTEAIARGTINLPALAIQQKIASILSAYDDLIENNLKRIKILEEMAQMIYREWFVNFRFPEHEKVNLVQSELGVIPEGWEVKKFTDIADVLSGGTPKTDVPEYWNGSIPFFTPRDAPNNFYVLSTDKNITELGLAKCNSKLYPKNTIFITARGTVGKVVMPSLDMAMNQSCYALVGKSGLPQLFLFMLTLQCIDILKRRTGGATFDTIIIDTFEKLKVLVPLTNIVKTFVETIMPLFDEINYLLMKNSNLQKTRDLLLPKLISGEVLVNDIIEEKENSD